MTPHPIARRDLLLLRSSPPARVYELPCQQLYIRYVDARRGQPDLASRDEAGPGEPDAVFDAAGPRAIFAALAAELGEADVLRVLDREWLADPELGREVDRLVSAFRARGGRVELGEAADERAGRHLGRGAGPAGS